MNNYREMYEVLLKGNTLYRENSEIKMLPDGSIVNEMGGIKWIENMDFRLWSIKLKTININGFEVPEPVREPLECGVQYYIVQTDRTEGCLSTVWDHDDKDKLWLSKGLIHLTEAAAVLHAKALWSFTAKEGV